MSTELQVKNEAELALNNAFEPFRKQAAEWMEKAKTINVTDESQTGLMVQAREARLALKKTRCSIVDKHAELKEESLRKGQELDKIKRELVGLIEPIEKHLEEQEKFAEVQEQKRKIALFNTRFELLKPFIGEEARKIALGEFSEDAFNAMLTGYQAGKEQREANEKEAARQREQQLKDHAAEQQKIREENEKLRKENEVNNKKLEAEKAKRKKLEKEAADKKAEEEKAERERKAEERKVKRAPDKDKLEIFITTLEECRSEIPGMKDEDLKDVVDNIDHKLEEIQKYIRAVIKDL